MKKFFLFRKEEVNASSVTASDSGKGLSVLALPADSLAFASADRGSVVLAFNSATKYEESNLTDGESLEKTTVKIPCETGKEVDLIESILSFISREGGKSIMKFDAVDQTSTFSPISFDSQIEPKVHINPTKRFTGEPSTQTFLGSGGAVGITVTSNVIADIDFGVAENKPLVDFNHEGLAGFSATAEVTGWDNGGTGGASYDIASNVGTPVAIASRPHLGTSQKSAQISPANHFIVPTVTVQNDYTIYMVLYGTASGSDQVSPVYSSADTQTLGPTLGSDALFNSDGSLAKFRGQNFGNFSVRHDLRTGSPASTETSDTSNGTVSFKYIRDLDGLQDVVALVVRRDSSNNMYMYNGDGDVVGFIPAKTASSTLSLARISNATDGRTDGDLVVERLGTVGDLTASAYGASMQLARFGIITKDIGSAACSKLATDLFNFYKV